MLWFGGLIFAVIPPVAATLLIRIALITEGTGNITRITHLISTGSHFPVENIGQNLEKLLHMRRIKMILQCLYGFPFLEQQQGVGI